MGEETHLRWSLREMPIQAVRSNEWSERGHKNTATFAALSNQNPGVITIAKAVFGSDPRINPDVLTKAFQVDKKCD
ncbi:hypothetical protein FEM48_Zijuj02G0176600 [Ziziphus jujuba var. spinosa]|uniref:Cupin type-1 domain-containing protein n=1 Tax=Ziziphus jujuba var. spinosa TaxID=714518 RepID=A0A978VX21_ZIZJJ|nr:hypothetical protein FEM48_Zijuj02G0176600 [Ziziphus jujuba var. spinosa]